MHKGIDHILAKLMARNGDNQVSLSRETGVGQSTISRILKPNGPKGIKSPTDDQVSRLAEYYRVSTDQLRGRTPIPELDGATGDATPVPPRKASRARSSADLVRDMLARHGKSLPAEAHQRIVAAVQEQDQNLSSSNVITADFSRRPLVGDEIRIAHYDVQGSMGGGKVVADYPEMFRDVTVSQRHLRELGVTYQDPSHLKLISGDGQSMAPTIRDKDPMIADASVREFTGDGIYAFAWQGHFYIKRLQMIDAEHFDMISDNPSHKDRPIRIDETYIQARVLLVWNAQKV